MGTSLAAALRADPGFAYHKLISGTVVALAMLTVLEGQALTEGVAMATLLLTLAAGAVSDAFSRGLAAELASGRRTRPAEAFGLLARSSLMLAPGLIPALAFAAVSADWIELGHAFAGACWLLVLGLFVAGHAAGRASRCSHLRASVYGVLISGFGLGIVALQFVAR